MPKRMLVALALVAVCLPAFAASVSIEADRMASVDGKRTFILGVYAAPKGDGQLDLVAKAGFNLVYTGPDKTALDALEARKLYGWINTGMSLDLSDATAEREAQLRKMAADFAGHPALLAWEVPDEALWNVWYGAEQWRNGAERKQLKDLIAALPDKAVAEKLSKTLDESAKRWSRAEYAEAEQLADSIWKELGKPSPNPGLGFSNAPERATKMADGFLKGFNLLREIDPKHPVWTNHAPRNSIQQLAAFDKAANAVGCDIYPVPEYKGGHSDLADRSLSSVGEYTRRMQEAAPGKPVWMVLQGFGWADLDETKTDVRRAEMRRPTFDESRFMAYDVIVNGARGILYWGSAYIEADSSFWGDLQKLVRELADLQPVLSAPDAKAQPKVTLAETSGSIDRGVRVLAKQAGDETVFIVVNEWTTPLKYTIGGLNIPNGVAYSDKTDSVSAKVENGALTFGIREHGVQVLRAAR